MQAGSWIMRAVKLLDDGQRECVQAGYLVLLSGMRAMFAGDVEAAAPQIDQAVAIADRFGDPDLRTLAGTGRGQALLAQGRIDEGIAVLDEVMVATTSGEVSATVAGLTYCAVISACHDVFDVRRAQEWSAALTHWCDDQPDLVPYTGWCQVHRAEIMELRGTWAEALDAATLAYERSLLSTDQATGGAARYLLGDVHRLRGDLELAEEAYREANRLGCEPQPGLALLRLAQGQLGRGGLDRPAGPRRARRPGLAGPGPCRVRRDHAGRRATSPRRRPRWRSWTRWRRCSGHRSWPRPPRSGPAPCGWPSGDAACRAAVAAAGVVRLAEPRRPLRGRSLPGRDRAGLPRAGRRGRGPDGAGRRPVGVRPAGRRAGPGPGRGTRRPGRPATPSPRPGTA